MLNIINEKKVPKNTRAHLSLNGLEKFLKKQPKSQKEKL